MSLRARDLMQSNVLTIPATMRFREIQRLLVETACHGAPVVDEGGTVVGVISAMDLLRAADQAYDDDLDPDEGDEPTVDGITAVELATPELVWVSPEASAEEVARMMRDRNIHRVLVGTDGKLLGLISTFDLLRAVS